ncbi:hypothetical protein P7C70_g6450, partial [Phenoliferia sp. Uapishka_3]
MLRTTSSTLLAHIIHLSSTSPTWLDPPNRAPLEALCVTYLSSLSFHLSSTFYPPLVIAPLPMGAPGSSLTAAAVMTATTVSLIEDVFPRTLGSGGSAGLKKRWPAVEELRLGVEGRKKVKEWRKGRSEEEKEWEWAAGEWATRAFMQERSDKWDSGMGFEDGEEASSA